MGSLGRRPQPIHPRKPGRLPAHRPITRHSNRNNGQNKISLRLLSVWGGFTQMGGQMPRVRRMEYVCGGDRPHLPPLDAALRGGKRDVRR